MGKPKVVYILPFYDEGTDTHLFYNYLLIRQLAERSDIDISVVVERDQKFKWPPLRFLELIFLCFKLRVSGFSNFYVHYSYYGALAGWLVGGRTFYWNRGMPWLFKRGFFEEAVLKFILRHTILVTGPESLAKEYQSRYGVKEFRVLSNWVDIKRFIPTKPRSQIFQDKRIVLFVHHLSKRKGADLVPEIAKGFGENVEFLIIGEGPERENLKLEIRNLPVRQAGWKLEKTVKLLGRVPNKEIIKYFHVSDVFIMPSREEGSPHVILEAMASGTPFVASDVGGVRELVPKELKGFLCEPEDIKCFQERIKTLLSDKALYDKARAIGLAHAKNFDIARGVKEFVNLFN